MLFYLSPFSSPTCCIWHCGAKFMPNLYFSKCQSTDHQHQKTLCVLKSQLPGPALSMLSHEFWGARQNLWPSLLLWLILGYTRGRSSVLKEWVALARVWFWDYIAHGTSRISSLPTLQTDLFSVHTRIRFIHCSLPNEYKRVSCLLWFCGLLKQTEGHLFPFEKEAYFT